ncbi:MAG: hypothetical protein ABII64_04285 [Elusimicrobiota bacterium]
MEQYVAIFVMSMTTMWLLKIQKRIMPKHYFYFGRLIDGIDAEISYMGLLFRISILLFTGFLIGIWANFESFPEPILYYGLAVGFFSAFSLVWPDFYNPELISPIYQTKKSKLYLLHILVIVFFSFLGSAGAQFSVSVVQFGYWMRANEIGAYIDTKAIFNHLLADSIWALLVFAGTLLIKFYVNSFKDKSNKLDQSGTA